MVKDLDVVFGKGCKSRISKKNMWKKRLIFWDLFYWEYLEVRYCIDVMYVEKNVCDSLIGFLLNIRDKIKDGVNVRFDLVDMDIRSELVLIRIDKGRTYFFSVCYILFKAERIELCQCLYGVKVSSGYSVNMKKFVSIKDLKLIGMKFYDCYVLMI